MFIKENSKIDKNQKVINYIYIYKIILNILFSLKVLNNKYILLIYL